MSEERVTLELLGARTLALTTEVHDLHDRMRTLETRFTAFEMSMTARMSALEQRMDRLIALVVRIAERPGGPSADERIATIEERLRSLEERDGSPRE